MAMRAKIAEIVRQAGAIVREAGHDKGVTEKSGHQDLVTRYDKKVQRFLEDNLLDLLPQAGFLGEEDLGEDVHADREWLFVVDPIDGTTNFVKEYPHCGISVGLYRNGQPEIGVIYDPYLDELFEAQRGQGAFLNGKPIHVSPAPMADAVTVMGTSPYYRQFADVTFAMGRQLFDRSLDIRRAASAALDLCYIAAGRVDCYFECLLSPWDYAAGALIVTEAGGVATDLEGKPLRVDCKCSLAAGNAPCHRELLDIAAACGFSLNA